MHALSVRGAQPIDNLQIICTGIFEIVYSQCWACFKVFQEMYCTLQLRCSPALVADVHSKKCAISDNFLLRQRKEIN
jgi:hypothetical protein